MANYTYPNTGYRFGERDTLSSGSTEKIIKGEQFDPEFDSLALASASKMENDNPVFTGTMAGGIINCGTGWT